MIGALVAILSLNLTLSLVKGGQIAGTLPVTGVTATTPMRVSSPAHGVPLGRALHGVVTGVQGTTEANGLWVCTPTDQDTFSLSTYDAQGNVVQSSGSHAYVSGGTISYAFPDYQILLGRRWIATAGAVASPRVVFVPTDGPGWTYESYGTVGITGQAQRSRGNAEQQSLRQNKLYATQLSTFEVHVTACANPPSPDFGDFDAVQALVHLLYQRLFEDCTPDVATVLRESWPSQDVDSGTLTQRGQRWVGVVQFKQPVQAAPLSFVPVGTSIVETIEPVSGAPEDETVITIPGV